MIIIKKKNSAFIILRNTCKKLAVYFQVYFTNVKLFVQVIKIYLSIK